MSESPNPFNGPAGLLDFTTVPTKGVVTSVNAKDGDIILAPGTNVTIVEAPSKTFTINAAGGGGGGVTSVNTFTGDVTVDTNIGLRHVDNVPPNNIQIQLAIPAIAFFRNSTQIVTDTVDTEILWQNQDYRCFWPNQVTPRSRIVVPLEGVYRVASTITLLITPGSGNVDFARYELWTNSGGSHLVICDIKEVIPPTIDSVSFTVVGDYYLNAGDEIWTSFLTIAAVPGTPRTISGGTSENRLNISYVTTGLG